MSQSCPISFYKVDSIITRINAVYITLLIIIFLLTSSTLILFLLIYDFTIRLYNLKNFSFIYQLSKLTQKIFQFKSHLVDGAAKRLATYFGLSFIVLLLLTSWLHMQIILYIVATVFLACTSLEILFNYCIGCKIYFIIKKIYPKFMN